MTFLALLLEFLKALPVLLELFKVIQQHVDESTTNATVTTSINSIKEAFNAKDASKLNALFTNGTVTATTIPSPTVPTAKL